MAYPLLDPFGQIIKYGSINLWKKGTGKRGELCQAAPATRSTAATMTNPMAMTCAAIGAIYYGWGALSDLERNEILEKLSNGLAVGIELIKSIVRFVIDKTKELLSPKNIDEIKKFIASAAAVFGKTLGDVTHKVTDIAGDTFDLVRKKSGQAVGKTIDVASDAYRNVSKTAEKAAGGIRKKLKKQDSTSSTVTKRDQ